MIYADLRRRIDARLDVLAPAPVDTLCIAMREAVTAPGKRIRPILVCLAAEDIGAPAEAALDAGCALEMVHAASLLLDDLPCMDDSPLRRGLPSVHVRYGEDIAILAAVGLLSRGFGVLAAIDGIGGETRARLVSVLAGIVGDCGLVGGQYRDLHAEADGSARTVERVNHLKTGVLFTGAMEMVVLIGAASPQEAARLQGFAGELGQAFQLFDDLLDRTGQAAEIGKPVGQDEDKQTLVSQLGESGARARLDGHLDAMRRAAVRSDGAPGSLSGLIDTIFPLTPAPQA
jgi:geranylgeranyl diphosphate synthase, type II